MSRRENRALFQSARTCCWVLALCLAACGKPDPKSAETPVAGVKAPPGQLKLSDPARAFLSIEALVPSESSAARTYFGRTAFRPNALSTVTAPFAGRVAAVAIEPGRRVRAGSTLFTIQSGDVLGIRASLDQARIKARVAEEVLARQTEMVKRGVGLEIERFDAEMKLREARSELERSERNAALAGGGEGALVEVRSPVEGVVVAVRATAGATVQPGGDPLVEIGNPGGLWVVADVPEGEVNQVAKSAKAQVTISALNLTLEGRIAGVAPRSDAETRRTPIYVELIQPPADLRAGLLVRVAMVPRGGAGELWLPVTAVLLKEGGKRVVYLEDKAGGLVAREIETGDERNGRVRVLKGLEAGERVVMRGALLVDREAEQLL
jgi:cobalt-zinc-cadmium efflux system membrane fusion protein